MGKILTALRLNAAYDTILFRREMFYLVVGCALLLAIDWLKDRVFLNESPKKT
jgi:hypothetical protein